PMQQVLFRIPIPGWGSIPIYGFGMMLFLAFVICTWLGTRRARKENIPSETIQDLAIWVFFSGIVGPRLVFMLVEHGPAPLWEFMVDFVKIWDGGLVYYGSLAGGVVGFCLAYLFLLRRKQIPFWKMADVLAPPLALGICLGRIGCLLNGC